MVNSCFLPQCQTGRYPHPQIFNNCYSNASSWAELGWQPRTRRAGGKQAPFVVPEGIHRSTGVIWALWWAEQVLLCSPADSHPLQGPQPGTPSEHQALLLRNNNHWTMRPLHHAEALFHGSHSQQGQPGLPQARSLRELAAWTLVLRNTDKRSLMDIYYISLLLCTLRVGERRKSKVPTTFSMQISFFKITFNEF